MGSNTAGPGSERGPRVAWQGHTHTHSPPSPPRGASYTQPSPAAGDTGFGVVISCIPYVRQALPVGKRRSTGNGGGKTIIHNGQWVHSTSALTATGLLNCPPLSSPSTALLPSPAQPLDQKFFSFLLPPFPMVILAEFMKKR